MTAGKCASRKINPPKRVHCLELSVKRFPLDLVKTPTVFLVCRVPDEALMTVIVGISQVSLAKLAGTVKRAPRVIPNAFVVHSLVIRGRHCSTFPSRFPNPTPRGGGQPRRGFLSPADNSIIARCGIRAQPKNRKSFCDFSLDNGFRVV